MRRVIITGTPPQDWIDEAKLIARELSAATTKAARAAIIKTNKALWTDDRIRNWLLGQFNNKCWYSEAQESVSSFHVDHYRPKGRIKQMAGTKPIDGYWWLAFDWNNYRICGQLLNVKKADLFPISEGCRCTHGGLKLELEAPILIDPLTDQARFISFDKDEDACIAVAASGLNDQDKARAVGTIDIMGLNRLTRLNDKRNEFWDKCMMRITDHQQVVESQALRVVQQTFAQRALKEMVDYNAEFSSVSEACLRKNAPESLMASIFDGRG